VSDPRRPEISKVIEPEELKSKTGYSGPHTVHCMPGDIVTISMLGDENGDLPGGLAVLDAKDFSVLGRWEQEKNGQEFMYDFWYQPRQNTMLTASTARTVTGWERRRSTCRTRSSRAGRSRAAFPA
jgi:selenium-binding protein 1